MRKLIVAAAVTGSITFVSASALADSNNHGGHGAHMKSEQMGAHQYHVAGTVNSMGMHKMNVTHEKIPALGWPPMTMDFAVADGVDVSKFKSGDEVIMTIQKGHDGMYQISDIKAK